MNPYYSYLLSPLRVGNVILKNRMICPPSQPYHGQAGEKWPSDTLIECYASRARGGAAIVTCDGNGFGKIWVGATAGTPRTRTPRTTWPRWPTRCTSTGPGPTAP